MYARDPLFPTRAKHETYWEMFMLLSVDGEDGVFGCPCIFLLPLAALEGVACFLLGDCMIWC